jgi:fatty-acid desaturase
MGITIGYHRLLSHRSFKCSKLVEYFWVAGGYLAFDGSPIWWTAIHRAHHKYTDTVLDPHSPRYGLENAYCGWMRSRSYPAHIDPGVICPDVVKDRLYRLLECGGNLRRSHRLTALIGLLFRVGLLCMFGWEVALGSLLAGFAIMQVPLLLNVACHIPALGYKTFSRDDDSVNVWWVALLAHGEGWHNNHHAFPGSARSGFKREFDLSWETLRLLRAVGLVRAVNEAKPELIDSRQLVAEPTPAPEIAA